MYTYIFTKNRVKRVDIGNQETRVGKFQFLFIKSTFVDVFGIQFELKGKLNALVT